MEKRKADYPIESLILNRSSPRAFSNEKVSDEELMSLFEAARWAPSCYNNQPWRFLYGKQGTAHFDKLFNLLIDFNKSWCKKASVLCLVLSLKNFEKTGKYSQTHAFDTGAAWQNLALEASAKNLVAHGMQGFNYEEAREIFSIPEEYEVLAMFALGKKGKKEDLSKELQEKEVLSSRKPISEIAFEGHL